MREQQRVEVIQRVIGGKLEMWEAEKLLGCCERTVYRMCSRALSMGLKGLVHGNKGRASPRRTPLETREQAVQLAKSQYAGVNDSHMRELLATRDKIKLGRETLRELLRAAGIKAKQQKRRSPYRSRRERKPAMGMMLQIDTSFHRWLEGRAEPFAMVGAVDDATGYTWGHFCERETTWGYLELMRKVLAHHGVPLSLYSDRHTIFHVLREATIVEQLKDVAPLTQFGRAMDELGVTIIKAWSPQAKGRVERRWRDMQDRLVVELRLGGVSTVAEANAFLDGFLERFNAQFSLPPRQAQTMFRRPPCDEKLAPILCIKEVRVVNGDHTVSVDGLVLQIPDSKRFHSLARKQVQILQHHDGGLDIQYQGRSLVQFSPQAMARLIQKHATSQTNLKVA